MNIEELKAFIASKHSPDAGKQPGMVYQVWEDGEVTLQKSGELLWQRNLHCIQGGFSSGIPLDAMPEKYGPHAYAYCATGADASAIRKEIEEFVTKA